MPRMADSITPANLPAGFDAYLGYVDGRWPDYQQIAAQHGNVPVYGLTTSNHPIGDGSDVEPGNGTVQEQAACTKADIARGVARPIAYCPESWAVNVVNAHNAVHVVRSAYRLLTAHYKWPHTLPGKRPGEHICGPSTCGCPVQADGTQWADFGPYDESLLSDSFITVASHPGPVQAASAPQTSTTITGDDDMARRLDKTITTDPKGNGWWDFDLGGSVIDGACWCLDASPGTPAPQPDGERFDIAHAEYTVGAAAGFQRVEIVAGSPNAGYAVSMKVAP